MEGREVAMGAGVAVVVGSISPWATITTVFGSVSVNGTDGDGKLTLGLGVALCLFALLRRPAAAFIAAGLTALAGGYDLINIRDKVGEFESDVASASVGWGLWLVVIAGVVG